MGFLGYLSANATLAPQSFGYCHTKECLKVKCANDVIQSSENPDIFVEVEQVRFSFKKLDPDIYRVERDFIMRSEDLPIKEKQRLDQWLRVLR